MRLLVLFFCLMTSCFGLAQENRVLFKIAPLALIDDFSFPTVQGGLEISLNPRVSWYNEIGIMYRKSGYEDFDTSMVARKGFKAKTEVRYYYSSKKDKSSARLQGPYIAINFFYIRDIHNASCSYYYQKDSSTVINDNFGVTKSIWGSNVILGYQSVLGKRFMYEIYGGLGVRIRDIITVNKEFDYKRDDLKTAADMTVSGFAHKAEAEGRTSVLPGISFGVRFAYRLF